MINVQSSVALELLDEHPERAGPALAAIKDASRQAISDVHSLVTALRTDARATHRAHTRHRRPGRSGRHRPRHRPDREHRRAGRAAPTARGDRRRRGPHRAGVADQRGAALDGPKRRGHSDLRARTNWLWPSTTTGAPLNAGPASGGSGIAGMRERARALGGELTVRRQPGGGFSVRATLPLASKVKAAHDDSGARRRRPGAGARRLRRAAGRAGRHRGGRGGRHRNPRAGGGPRTASRRGADGHPDAGDGRAGRDPRRSPPTRHSPRSGWWC